MRQCVVEKAEPRRVDGDEAAIAAQTLEQADLTVVPAKGHLPSAVAIAAELDHPAYDGIYLAIAEALGLRLVTADARLIRKVNQTSLRFRPMLATLAEFG